MRERTMCCGAWRTGMATLLVLLAACAPSGGASADSTSGDTTSTAETTTTMRTTTTGRATPTRTVPAATPIADTAHSRIGTRQPPATDKVAPSPGHASSGGGARVTGGPERAPQLPRNSGCGGAYVNVTVKASALEGTTLGRVAADLLAPLHGVLGAPSLSPAIRAFRVQLRDGASADRAVTQLRTSSSVATAERDGCAVMIER